MQPAIPTSTSSAIYRTNTARIVTRNLRPLGAFAVWLALVAGLLGMAGSQPGFGAAAIGTLVLGPLFYALGMWSAKKGDVTASRGSVLECSHDGVCVDGRVVIARSEIDNGAVAPDLREGGSLVLLGRKSDIVPKHTLHAKNADEATAILAALGLDVAHNTLVHREAGWFAYGSGPTTLLGGGFVLGMLSFLPLLAVLHGNALAMLPAALGMTAFFGTMWTTRSEIVVGADGVLLRWLGKQRYCAFADVERCEPTERGVILHTASTHLRVALESTASGDDAALADALAELSPTEDKAASGSV